VTWQPSASSVAHDREAQETKERGAAATAAPATGGPETMTTMIRLPRTPFDSFASDPFFRGLFELADAAPANHGVRSWYPALDLVDADDKLVVHVEIPGMDAKDVQVSLQNDVLTVHGERKSEIADKAKVLKREQVFGEWTRTVELPYRVQNDRVKASAKNGVMTITLPKAEEHVGRSIPVEIES
jgi:HSP20 family protein